MTSRKLGAFVAIWLVGYMVMWPAVLADFQRRFHVDYRSDLEFSLIWSAAFWPLVPFITGFFERGFCITRDQCSRDLSAKDSF